MVLTRKEVHLPDSRGNGLFSGRREEKSRVYHVLYPLVVYYSQTNFRNRKVIS